jgi:hypothetical protein
MTDAHFHTIEAKGIRATVDLRAGQIRALEIEHGGRTIQPIHTAPWVDDPAITGDESIPANLRFLSGDFFCAPFAASDLDDAPLHGWAPNAPWTTIESGAPSVGRYELSKRILGARLIKELAVRDGHPFLYERHIFIGGAGSLPVASHGMTRFDAGGTLSFSPKLFGETPATPLETDPAKGRSCLVYPTQFTDITRVPMERGGFADLTRYPIGKAQEDFVSLVEDPKNPLGWAAALRPDKRDIYLSLKSPKDFPITMMWFSNGGRDYTPWSGRHLGVLGLEEGRTYAGSGHKSSIADNPWRRLGIATALDLDPKGEVEVRNVIGGVALPDGWQNVTSISSDPAHLHMTGAGGQIVSIPFDGDFLAPRQ